LVIPEVEDSLVYLTQKVKAMFEIKDKDIILQKFDKEWCEYIDLNDDVIEDKAKLKVIAKVRFCIYIFLWSIVTGIVH